MNMRQFTNILFPIFCAAVVFCLVMMLKDNALWAVPAFLLGYGIYRYGRGQ